jgi:DNA-directed RNA polymerase subunit alpha
MPIHKMNFEVKEIYKNSKLIKEDLFLDIWTNGSITPKKSILSSSNIIIDLFTKFVKNKFSEKLYESNNKKEKLLLNSRTDITIEELQLSVRAYNCLKRENINTLGDLLKYSPEQLQELKNFGKKSADEVIDTLKNQFGIIFK